MAISVTPGDVGAFDGAANHPCVGRRAGLHTGWRNEEIVGLAGERLRLGEGRDLQLSLGAGAGEDGAVFGDRDVGFVPPKANRASSGEHRIALSGHERALRIELEGAIARIALAVGRVDDKEAFAVQRRIERIAGLANGAAGQIMHGRPVLGEGHILLTCRKAIILGAGHDKFFKQHLLALEADGVEVGHVVSHHVHLALKGDLP